MEDKNQYIHFPLCCLNYSSNILETAELIISYGVVEFAKKLEDKIILYESDYGKIDNFIEINNILNAETTDEEDAFIILSCMKIGIIPSNLIHTIENHSKLKSYIQSYEQRNGKDAIVRVHKSIIFEVRDKQFNENMFRVYCAILSILGKKQFLRITNKRISYRMLGFKDTDTYFKEKSKSNLLTARQIKTITDKLYNQNLVNRITYKNRLTFYSIRFRGKAFNDVLINAIANNKLKKEKSKLNNMIVTDAVSKKYEEIKSDFFQNMTLVRSDGTNG